jgi:hypothetical protein
MAIDHSGRSRLAPDAYCQTRRWIVSHRCDDRDFHGRSTARTGEPCPSRFATHPFHPLFGQTFELLRRRKAWGDERVMYLDASGTTKQIPLAWTNLAPVDAFVEIAAGRCAVRFSDLVVRR